MKTTEIEKNETDTLSYYLTERPCPESVAADYILAVKKLNIVFSEKQYSTWKKMMRSRFFLRAIDSGLALVNPSSLLRKKIFVMLCLLEADKNNVDLFLPKKRNMFYFITLFLSLSRAIFFAISGIFIVKIIDIK